MGPRNSPAGAPGGMKNGSEQTPRELIAREPNGRELLIVGAGGMLGTALTRVALRHGYTPRACTEAKLDSTDLSAVRETVADFAAQAAKSGALGAVVNAAAYTDVERAEDDAERAFMVNGHAAGWLAAAAWAEGLAYVHVSTDFVFDGTKGAAYVETDDPRPLSVYGASKLAGERAVFAARPDALVVRTAWMFGLGGASFPVKILQRARALTGGTAAGFTMAPGPTGTMHGTGLETPVLRVVADEIGSPTYTNDLAGGLLALLSAGATGLYHMTAAGSCSRYEQALETLRLAGFAVPADLTVEPVPSASFPARTVRPRNSVLDCTKASGLGVQLPAWQESLARFLTELQGDR
jgi:dTDP-4-dehydrorhamnose reductase